MLDPVSGALRWQRTVGPDDRYAVYDSVLVIASNAPADRKIRALNWADGTTKWEFATPGGVESTTYVVDEPAVFTTPGQYNGAPYRRADENARVIQVDDKRTLRVIDVATGNVREKTNVADKTDTMKAVGNRLYVVSRADALQIRQFDLTRAAPAPPSASWNDRAPPRSTPNSWRRASPNARRCGASPNATPIS